MHDILTICHRLRKNINLTNKYFGGFLIARIRWEGVKARHSNFCFIVSGIIATDKAGF